MKLGQPLRHLGQLVLDTFFPPRCAACGSYGSFLCIACADALPRARPPRCPRCWRMEPSGDVCWRCRRQPPTLTAVRSPFIYAGPSRAIIHAFKYDHISALAPPMAALMADTLRQHLPSAAALVPVPLSSRREHERGYNQAALLARELARLCGWPLAERALTRRRNTPPQAQLSGPEAVVARYNNMRDAFAVRAGVLPEGASVVLVDDVMTTGATLNACAQALKEGGAGAVYGLVFARED